MNENDDTSQNATTDALAHSMRILMREYGIKPFTLARAANVSHRQVNNLFNGGSVRMSTGSRLAAYLGVPSFCLWMPPDAAACLLPGGLLGVARRYRTADEEERKRIVTVITKRIVRMSRQTPKLGAVTSSTSPQTRH